MMDSEAGWKYTVGSAYVSYVPVIPRDVPSLLSFDHLAMS